MFKKTSQTPMLTCIEPISAKDTLNCNKDEEENNNSESSDENSGSENGENSVIYIIYYKIK